MVVESSKSLRLPELRVCSPWKKLPTHLIVEMLIHYEILLKNSANDQFALGEFQA